MLFIIMAAVLLVALVAPSWERFEEREIAHRQTLSVCDSSGPEVGPIAECGERSSAPQVMALAHRYHARWYTGSTARHTRAGFGPRNPRGSQEGFPCGSVFLFWA